jgi:hypothetical protein
LFAADGGSLLTPDAENKKQGRPKAACGFNDGDLSPTFWDHLVGRPGREGNPALSAEIRIFFKTCSSSGFYFSKPKPPFGEEKIMWY